MSETRIEPKNRKKYAIGLDNRLSIIAQALNDYAAEGGYYSIEPKTAVGDPAVEITIHGVRLEIADTGTFLVVAED